MIGFELSNCLRRLEAVKKELESVLVYANAAAKAETFFNAKTVLSLQLLAFEFSMA